MKHLLTSIQIELLNELIDTTPFDFVLGVEAFNKFISNTFGETTVKKYNKTLGAFYSCKDQEKSFIFLLIDRSPATVTKTLFHELAHSTGLKLGRRVFNQTQQETNIEEVIAELTALNLCRYFNLNTEVVEEACSFYIEMYALNLSEMEFQRAKVEAKKAGEYILKNYIPTFNREFIFRKRSA